MLEVDPYAFDPMPLVPEVDPYAFGPYAFGPKQRSQALTLALLCAA
jgi:hypothetical protein